MDIDLKDTLMRLHAAYESLCLMAMESNPCSSRDVGNVLGEINKQFSEVLEK